MQELLYEECNRTVFLTLNRTQVRNCFSMKLSDELIGAIERVRASETLRFLVIRGADETFCAGDNISVMPWGNERGDAPRALLPEY